MTYASSKQEEHMEEFNISRDNVYLSLVNHESSKDKLTDSPTRRFLDMDVVYSLSKPDPVGRNEWLSNSDMEKLGMTEEELYETALHNTMQRFPARIERLEEVLKHMMSYSDESAESLDLSEDYMFPLYFFGNESYEGGSAVILYGNILNRIADLFGEGFYLIPSSVHEYLIAKESDVNDSLDYLSFMVYSVNRTCLSPEQVLSDSVYHYCFKSNLVSVVSSI
jgi:hypothetical protein